MSIVRYRNRHGLTPWSALSNFDRELDRFLSDLTPASKPAERTWMPPVDIQETDDSYVLEADLPGITKEDLELEVLENVITLKGKRESKREENTDKYRRYERRTGTFQRSFEVPGGFDGDKVTAEFEHGVLKVTIPKREEAKSRQIPVKIK